MSIWLIIHRLITGGGIHISTTHITPLHIGKGKNVGSAIKKIIDYVENPQKTENGKYITSWNCDSRTADAEFAFAKRQYTHRTGRTRRSDDIVAYTVRQAFVPGEITPEEANRLGCELAHRFLKDKHAFIVCTHVDKHHIHNHIVWDATSLDYSRKFRNFYMSFKAVQRLNDTICIENGYSIIENPHCYGLSYNKWLGENKEPSHRERICYDIDSIMEEKPETFEALLSALRCRGYDVKVGKVLSIKGGTQKRYIRMDTLGEGYTPEDLTAAIAGRKKHEAKQRSKAPELNLIIDIQQKLSQGKGAGYERWAKKFNLKQMAQTVVYLQEHNLMDYAALKETADTITGRYNVLSEKIKSTEMRMNEIAEMRKQIINYAKTREAYVAYRKAGYSKKFLAEHESEIIIHKAAKKYFTDQGLQKLPSIKELQAEYVDLLNVKKTAYVEYRTARNEMKDILTAKANVEKILEIDGEHDQQKIQKGYDKEQR